MPGGPARTTPTYAADGAGSRESPTSIAPVGLELPDADVQEDVLPSAQQTLSIRPIQARRLRGIVIGAVAGCALILVAAVVARVSRASDPAHTTAIASAPATGAAAASRAPTPGAGAPAAGAPSPASAAAPSGAASPGARDEAHPLAAIPPPPTDGPVTGTLRVQRPATPGRVWLDGRKLTSGSALVSCGAHQLRVGRGRARSVQVPCGGELVVSR